jgi:glycerol kinase
MKKEQFVLALDQGTTSSRALLFDRDGKIRAQAQQEYPQHFPHPGWVEHDPAEIWASQRAVAAEAMDKAGIGGNALACIGITNQRETTIVWDRASGRSLGNAIVWQDRRTSGFCDELKRRGMEAMVREKTGLVIDAYFSGPKIRWILDHVKGAREQAERGELAFGTVDSWLIWNLSKGKKHVTDAGNASRTMLFNIHRLDWDEELLALMDIPRSMLPEVVPSSGICGHADPQWFGEEVPVAGLAGDQQAALFGQMCTGKGMVKNTYGTGCFLLINTGDKPFLSKNKLLATVAWQLGGKTTYALEGSIFMAGAVVQWLRDGLGIIGSSSEVEELARQVQDSGDLFLVPSFTGMGAPYWDQYARGLMIGINRGTSRAHIARAALEGIAYQTMDVLHAMKLETGMQISELRVDGGASANDLLMQFQADILRTRVVRPHITETTALGAAYLAGLATGFWKDMDALEKQWQAGQVFEPQRGENEVLRLKDKWADAVSRARSWSR